MKKLGHFLLHVLYTLAALLFEAAIFLTIRDAARLSGLAFYVLAAVFLILGLATIGFSAIMYEPYTPPPPWVIKNGENPHVPQVYVNSASDEQRDDLLDSFSTKVKGVTFSNDDGSDRQSILSCCYAGLPVKISPFKFQGRPAFAVKTCFGQIGNISADIAESFADMYGANAYMTGEIGEITGGYDDLSYGCILDVNVWKSAKGKRKKG